MIKVDHSLDEGRPEHPDAAEVHEVQGAVGPDRVVAQMGIAVDDAVGVKRQVPGAEQIVGHPVPPLEGLLRDVQERPAVEPGHGQQPPGRELGHELGHLYPALAPEHGAVEGHVTGLALVVQLLAQAGGDLGVDLAGRHRPVVALVDRHHQLQLVEIGLDRRLHVGVLELAGERAPVEADGPVNLAQGSGPGRLALERLEAALPVRAQLRRHAAPDEAPAHGGRVGLELGQLLDVLLGQRVGNGGYQLGDLHQRALEPAERRPQLRRVLAPVEVEAEIARARDARGQAADRRRDPGIAPDPAGERAAFRGFGHAESSSSSMKPSMTPSPLAQNAGSPASRPNGSKSSLWRRVPPAFNSSRYFSSNPAGASW